MVNKILTVSKFWRSLMNSHETELALSEGEFNSRALNIVPLDCEAEEYY